MTIITMVELSFLDNPFKAFSMLQVCTCTLYFEHLKMLLVMNSVKMLWVECCKIEILYLMSNTSRCYYLFFCLSIKERS